MNNLQKKSMVFPVSLSDDHQIEEVVLNDEKALTITLGTTFTFILALFTSLAILEGKYAKTRIPRTTKL